MCKAKTLLSKNKQGALSICACGNYRLTFNQLCWELTAGEYEQLNASVASIQTSDWELELNHFNWYAKIPLNIENQPRTLCCSEEDYTALSFLLKGHQYIHTTIDNLSLN